MLTEGGLVLIVLAWAVGMALCDQRDFQMSHKAYREQLEAKRIAEGNRKIPLAEEFLEWIKEPGGNGNGSS